MAIAMKRGLQETIHLVTIELIKKCNYRVSMLGKPANIKYWLFCHIDFSENGTIKNKCQIQSQYWVTIGFTLFVSIASWLEAAE